MAEGDFSVYARIQADTKNFEKGMKQAQASATNLSNTFNNVSKMITKALSFAGLAIGTKAIVDFGKSCVQSATQATKQFNILDNTIKATGADAWTSTKEMGDMAKSLSDSTNYSVTEIEKMQSVLLGFRDITGETFQDASDAVLDMATVMGMDLTSAVQTVGKALDDPVKGLDSLRRQGFAFTDEQKIELKQLVATGKKLEAQKIILDELSTTYGGAAKAGQDSFAKQRHAVENFKDTLGSKLIPIVKTFAEDNANMINSLRELIEKTDFTPVVNVIKNLKTEFANAFNIINDYLKQGANWVKDFIDRFNFGPLISLLDTFAGVISGVVNKIKEMSSQQFGFLDQMKESLISFSNSESFTKIVEYINKVVDVFFFLWEEIQDISIEIRNLIFNKIIEIWNKLKELFENGQTALENSGQDITSWAQLFWTVLDNVYRIFQDLINAVKAILNKDWAVAWEYAKLAVMRVADNILTMISTIANAFPDLINGMIDQLNKLIGAVNKVRGWFGQDPLGLIEAFDSVDLSEKTGLAEKIAKTEEKIEELTGHVADNAIQTLNGVSTHFAGFTFNALGFIQNLTDGTEEEAKKQKRVYKDTTDFAKDSYKKFSEWDLKLLNQRADKLKDYSDEYHKIQVDIINSERKKALETADTEEERLKINEYYNKEIEKENERAEEAKRKAVKETLSIIAGNLKSIASTSIATFKKVASTIKNVFSNIAGFIKNSFSKIKNIFSTLFDFNVDDALDNLLEIEDAILTFFVETLPQLPSFFSSALSSVLILIQTIINSIDWDKVSEFLNSITDTFVKYAPEIISGIITIFTNLVTTIADVITSKAGEIVNAFGSIFISIIENLPAIITKIIEALGTLFSEIGKYFTSNAETITKNLTSIIKSIIDGISNFIKDGGWKDLLQGLLSIQKAIEKAITDNIEGIVNTIADLLPDLIDTLIDSIVSASKTLGKLAKKILPLVAKLINAIVEVLTSDEVVEASIEAIEGIVEGLIPAIVDILVDALPKIIEFFLIKLPSYTPKLALGIIKGIIKGFTKIDWKKFIKDLCKNFVKVFQDFFGIHSPSTLFEGFGENMLQGLWLGIKNLGGWLKDNVLSFFSNLWNGITSIFSNVGNWFADTFKNCGSSIKKGFDNMGDWASSVWSDIKKGFSNVGSWFADVFSTAWKNAKKGFSNVGEWAGGVWEDIKSGFSKMGTWFANTFESIKNNMVRVFEKIGDVLKTPFNAIIKMINKIIDGLNKISFDFPKWVPGVGGKSFGINISKIKELAVGTQNAYKGLTLVGEAGPELVDFKGGERVYNATNTEKVLGNSKGSNVFNVTFNNMQDTTAFAMLSQLKQYQRNLAFQGVL